MAATATEVDVRAFTLKAIQERIDQGLELREAVQGALVEIQAAKLSSKALAMLGPTPFMDFWRVANRGARGRVLGNPLAVNGRVVDLGILNQQETIMEAQWEVDGVWMRLGDMDRDDCLKLAGGYDRRAKAHAHKARCFELLARRLEGVQPVRKVWTEAELQFLFREEEA